MDLLVRMGLAVRTESGVEVIGKKAKPLTEIEIGRFELMYARFIKLWKMEFEENMGLSYIEPLKIAYNDETNSPIADWFNITSRRDPENTFLTFLFGETLRNEEGVYGNFFVNWDLQFVSFTNPAKKIKTEHGTTLDPIEITEKNDEIDAKDDGTSHRTVHYLP